MQEGGEPKAELKCSYNSLNHYKNVDTSFKRLTYWLLSAFALAGWITAIVFIVLWSNEYFASGPLPWIPVSNSGLSSWSQAAVAVDNGICSEIGRNMLMAGGNAVDGAIASLVCNGVMNPFSMGIGGGFFMVVYNSTTNRCTAIDARETATKAAADHPNMGDLRRGWKSIATPGEIDGYWQAHQKFGSLPWRDLWQPTIKLVTDGFYVPLPLSNALAHEWNIEKIYKEETMSIYINPKTQKIYEFGDKMTDPVLARTMNILANSVDPVKEFYSGELSKTFIKEIKDRGGFLDATDLSGYKSRVYNGYESTLPNGLTYCSLDLPSAGPAISAYLQMINHLDISGAKFDGTLDAAATGMHNMIEALKLVYSLWLNFADSDDLKLRQMVSLMKSGSYGKHLASQIPTYAHTADYYQQEITTFMPEVKGDTAHISVIDQHKNAVSVTSSLNYFFGAMVRSPATGIIWNNHMADFIPRVQNEQSRNTVQPGKKPRSAMAPIIIYNATSARPVLVLGGAGGSRILGTVATVAARVLFLNDTIKEAIDMPRFYISIGKDKIQVDKTMPMQFIGALEKLGHEIENTQFESKAEAVSYDGKYIYSNTDYRKPSYSAGF